MITSQFQAGFELYEYYLSTSRPLLKTLLDTERESSLVPDFFFGIKKKKIKHCF